MDIIHEKLYDYTQGDLDWIYLDKDICIVYVNN